MRFPKLSALALAASLASPAFAAGMFGGYAITSTGTANNYYNTDTASANPSWTSNLADLQQGSSLWLGGQVQTWPGGGGPDSFDSVTMQYSIDGSAAQSLNLNWLRNVGTNDQWETLASNTGAAVDIGNMLSAGIHTITVSFQAIDNNGGSGTQLLNNNGLGWTSSINVLAAPVPEPSSAVLLLAGLGMLGTIARRRRTVRAS